jgi:phenylacetate-CoA ligase
MYSQARRFVERALVGDSPPALVRWGKHVSPAVVRKIQSESFVEVVRYAAIHQRFFARQLREHGIDVKRVRHPEDLGDIFTTPEDLRTLPAADFLCHEPELVFETTGTSGGPKRVYFSYEELDFAARYEGAALYENGVRPGARVVCTFDAGYWISSWVTFLACRSLGVFCSATGKLNPREIYTRLGDYRYDVIAADPTWLVSLSEIAEKEGAFPMRLIMAAGDRMTSVYRKYVEEVWGCPVVLAYGSTEVGGAGMECRQQQGYHVDDFNIYFEIVDPDEDGYGELVATTLSRRTMPFIRYRVHDVTRFIEAPCPCGAPLRRIEPIRGRRDEIVVMGAGNMYPEMFERVLQDVVGIAENWQVAVRQEGLHDILEFRIELRNGASPSAVETAIQSNLRIRYPDVWANRACGMYELKFRFLALGSIEQGRKRRRLVDERVA